MIGSSSITKKGTVNTLKILTFSRIDCCWQDGPIYRPVRAWMRRKLCFNSPLLCERKKRGGVAIFYPLKLVEKFPPDLITSDHTAWLSAQMKLNRQVTLLLMESKLHICVIFHKKALSVLFRRG